MHFSPKSTCHLSAVVSTSSPQPRYCRVAGSLSDLLGLRGHPILPSPIIPRATEGVLISFTLAVGVLCLFICSTCVKFPVLSVLEHFVTLNNTASCTKGSQLLLLDILIWKYQQYLQVRTCALEAQHITCTNVCCQDITQSTTNNDLTRVTCVLYYV